MTVNFAEIYAVSIYNTSFESLYGLFVDWLAKVFGLQLAGC